MVPIIGDSFLGGLGMGAGFSGASSLPTEFLAQRLDAEDQRIADSVADDTALASLKAQTYGVDIPKVSTNGAVMKHAIQNGKAVFRFDGTRRHTGDVSSLLIPCGTYAAYFAVSSSSLANTTRYWYGFTGSAIAGYAGTLAGSPTKWNALHEISQQVSAGTLDTNFHIFSIHCNGAVMEFFLDGSSLGTKDPWSGDLNDLSALFVGHYNNTGMWIGDVGEILIYGAEHTALERGPVQNYLASRWGVTLA